MPLEFELRVPDDVEDGATLIVLLHGRGSDRHDLLGLRSGLPAGSIIVTPEAPFPGAAWGYGGGWAWYRYLGDDRPEPETFESAQLQLGDFLDALPSNLPVKPGTLVLGGFSQGATMSLAHALRRPGEIPHVLNFSGFLANHPNVRITPESVAGTRIFWGHGTSDASIPFSMAEAGRRTLRSAGADLETRDYPIGHWIEPTELADASAWIQEGIQPGGGRGGGGGG